MNRCLAHIINLATQALISTRSKAKYYSPDADDAHIPDLTTRERHEVGLVCAICVKARSSSQSKELFKSIQVEKKLPPLQLLLDMKVQWGSMYVMLMRAEARKEVCLMSAFCLPIQSSEIIFTTGNCPVCVSAEHERDKPRKTPQTQQPDTFPGGMDSCPIPHKPS